ncbi:[protein release factor]-glutamine N5-methyltransferase [Yoonia sediminilitoris]|uniref:Release factor glutamine methyltransferase n=2 Tax=Yoonia sediminilitoris TaxID=1286148 RepID=A0A2T6KCR1_9RHOB|nr:[protein release factor]-glutamine N5-methyltransferase [Yoonia sediminilitoris]RCW94230.1 [protein release factor]-glutamine N5-methyltransferase [Yoonia sediminilitoris]
MLLAHAMGVPSQRLTLLGGDDLPNEVLQAALGLVDRRIKGEPVSHILGRRNFFGREFFVDRRVLDPRPETEELVMAALGQPFDRVLDLGTGSGAIIVTLLAERPGAHGYATDLSEQALQVAEQNAQTHSVANRVQFQRADWLAGIIGRFDLIVSNPPYIAATEMEGLQDEVRLYEPPMALTDGADGLTAYRTLIAGAPAHLSPGGRLIVEIGPTQAEPVRDMMEAAGLVAVDVLPDLDGRDRVVSGKMPQNLSTNSAKTPK